MSRAWSGRAAQDVRRWWAARLPYPCRFCGELVDGTVPWDVDHGVPQSVDPSRRWDPDNLTPAHRSCNRRAGQALVSSRRRSRRRPRVPVDGTSRSW